MFKIVVLSFFLCVSCIFCEEIKPLSIQAPESLDVASWNESVTTKKEMKTTFGKLSYTVSIGSLCLPSKAENQSACISFVAYSANPTQKKRPICFCFNGGPGSSSVWIHMGLLGPKKVTFPSPLTDKNHRGILANNPDTLLSSADLVFIDPVATGFSTTSKKCDPKNYFGVEEDTSLFAQFIERYLSQYNKWENPKYLIGESYGTIRAVLLAKKLHETYFFDVDGIVLISQALDAGLFESDPSNELSILTTFPTIALAAQTEGLLDEKLQKLTPSELYEQSKQFVTSKLAPALLEKDIPQERLSQLALECSKWTALPIPLIEKAQFRITLSDFRKMVLQQKSKLFGRFDMRVKTTCPYHESAKDDPSFSLILNDFTTNINHYFTDDLKLKEPHPYIILNPIANQSWNWQNCCFMNYTSNLQEVFLHIPSIRVYVATGLFDCATTPFSQELCLTRLAIENYNKQVQQTFFEGGHMMYLDPGPFSKLISDLHTFVTQ